MCTCKYLKQRIRLCISLCMELQQMYGYSCRLRQSLQFYVQPSTIEPPRLNHSLNYPSELHRIIPTLRPDPLAILVKQPRNRQHSHRNEPEQTRRPAHSKTLIHLEREQGEDSTERVARHTICCHCRGAVQRSIRIDEVQRSAEEDAQIAPGEWNASEYG